LPRIIIRENRCFIEDNEADQSFLWQLDRELSYKVQGAEHTRMYKGYMNLDGKFVRWDGRNKLLEESNLSFPIGLLQRVDEFYKEQGRSFDIVDERPPKSIGRKIDLISKLKEQNKEPYPYQLAAVEATRQHDHGIIRVATGGGKSILSALVTADIGKETIIYVIGKDLLYQMHKLYTSLFDGIKIGIIGDGKCEIGFINIVSVWTVGQALGIKKTKIINEISDSDEEEKQVSPDKYTDIINLINNTKVHIIDECHIAACDTIQEIGKFITPEHIYGMSASPWRDDNSDLLIECILGKNIVDISASYLIDKGFLVQPIIKFVKVPKYEKKASTTYKAIYQEYIVENEVRNNLVVSNAVSLVQKGYKTLVLFNNRKHGDILYNKLKDKISCSLLSGSSSMKEREQAKLDLESGKINCLIASRILDIGVDIPILSGLVVAGSGKSSVRALQRIGRVIRKYPNKKFAAVVDFLDNIKYLKDHSIQRKKIYSIEENFIIK
jgi:superfamily II DNA or RNA helicase